MLKRVGILIDDPRWGIPVALVLALLPVTNIFAMVLVVLMLLRRGDVYAHLAYVLTALATGFAVNRFSIDMGLGFLCVLAAVFIPLWGMAVALRRLRSLPFSLEAGTVLLAILATAIYFAYGETPVPALTQVFYAGGLSDNQQVLGLATAMLLMWPFFVSVLQISVLLFARWVQSCLYYPGGFRADFHQLRLHKAITLLTAVLTAVVLYIGPESSESVMNQQLIWLYQLDFIGVSLLFWAGLGLVHWYVAFKGLHWGWLLAIYVLLLVAPAMMVLGIIALTDSFFNLRQRMIAGKQRGA